MVLPFAVLRVGFYAANIGANGVITNTNAW
jgi:hypothetical protein